MNCSSLHFLIVSDKCKRKRVNYNIHSKFFRSNEKNILKQKNTSFIKFINKINNPTLIKK